MSFATDMQATAKELLTEFGQPVQIVAIHDGEYDPTTSSVNDAETDFFEGVGHPEPYSAAEIASGLVRATDIQLLFYSDSARVPDTGNSATLDSVSYRIMRVDKLKAQGTDICYVLQLRI